MTKPRVIFSPTVTPPIAPGKNLKFAEMTPSEVDKKMNKRWIRDHITIVEPQHAYDGIFTGGITDCVSATVLERGPNGYIQRLLMIHFNGGINRKRLDAMLSYLSEKKMEKGGYRELIFTFGRSQPDLESAKKSLEILLAKKNESSFNIDDYLKTRHPELVFEPCLFAHVPAMDGSACVTMEGYAGPFYQNPQATASSLDGTPVHVTKKTSLETERGEFERLKQHFHQKDIKEEKTENKNIKTPIENVQIAMEDATCSQSTRADLYFLTREIIFNNEFKNPVQHEEKKSIEVSPKTPAATDVRAFETYKRKVNQLPLSSGKEKVFLGVTCCLGFGIVTTLPYFLYKRHQRDKNRDTLISFAKKRY